MLFTGAEEGIIINFSNIYRSDKSVGDGLGMNKKQHYLFAYGTLMKGLCNHKYLANQEFICKTEIVDFGLYNVTEDYPGIVRKQNSKVKGELYLIDEDLLQILDEFEGEEYNRIEVDVMMDNSKIRAYTYLWVEDIHNEDYVIYDEQPWEKRRVYDR